MNKFAEIARKEVSLSRVMENRTKITSDEIIAQYPQGITVTEFDFISLVDQNTKQEKQVAVISFSENTKFFHICGSVLTRICDRWTTAYHGDIDGASDELTRIGGVKMKLSKGRTKNGNNIVKVDILD